MAELARKRGVLLQVIAEFKPDWILISSEDLAHSLLREAEIQESIPPYSTHSSIPSRPRCLMAFTVRSGRLETNLQVLSVGLRPA